MELILIFSLLSPFLTLRHESTLCCAYRHIHRIPVLYIREEDISVIFRGFNKTSVGHIRPNLYLNPNLRIYFSIPLQMLYPKLG